MKKILFITLTAIALNSMYAQQGEIIYTDFEPDYCMTGLPSTQNIILDINNDGIDETLLYRDFGGHNGNPWVILFSPTDHPDSDKWVYRTLNYELTDTLNLVAHYGMFYMYYLPGYDYNSPAYDVTRTVKIAVRHTIDNPDNEEHYCYGWIEAIGRWTWDPESWWAMLTVCVTRMAYCTIPDYPLCYGQTSLEENINETKDLSVTVHPNPTNGIVTVTGENLSEIEVVNILGQTVLKKDCSDDIIIDLSNQPAGIYLLRITDKNGDGCTRKVIKKQM